LVRLQIVEQELRGRTVDQTFADDFLRVLTDAVDTAIPGRASQVYKRRAIMGLGLDMLHSLFCRQYEYSGSLGEMA
ncbi:MAG: molybdopterin dehydrogenase, partial [Hyphomicrobiales bacterium]|nr:molybdopterin dehydrogenase [Hyphomicrobiales bacterium]